MRGGEESINRLFRATELRSLLYDGGPTVKEDETWGEEGL